MGDYDDLASVQSIVEDKKDRKSRMRDVGLVTKVAKHGPASRDGSRAGGSSRANSSGNLRGDRGQGSKESQDGALAGARTASKGSSGKLRGTPHNAAGPAIERQDSGRLRAMDRINPNADATSKSGSTERLKNSNPPSSQNSKSGARTHSVSGTQSNNSRDNSRDNLRPCPSPSNDIKSSDNSGLPLAADEIAAIEGVEELPAEQALAQELQKPFLLSGTNAVTTGLEPIHEGPVGAEDRTPCASLAHGAQVLQHPSRIQMSALNKAQQHPSQTQMSAQPSMSTTAHGGHASSASMHQQHGSRGGLRSPSDNLAILGADEKKLKQKQVLLRLSTLAMMQTSVMYMR